MTSKEQNLPTALGACGVYRGACPSYNKSCHGCSSKKEQNRKSKWNCKLRECCYSNKLKSFCFECDEFPCKSYRRKLIESHPGDLRFDYRHELKDDFTQFSKLGLERFLRYQNEKWKCKFCEGRVHFYHYKCGDCGAELKYKK
jgi:hypothetical protein